MTRPLITLIIVIASIVIFSVPAARRSIRKDKVHGGTAAQIFHFIAVAAYVGIIPSALCGSFLVGPWAFGIPLAVTLLAIAFVSLLIHAYYERPARASLVVEDRGWTEEDARSSGL